MVVFSGSSQAELASKLIQQADSLSRSRYHGELLNAWVARRVELLDKELSCARRLVCL